VFEVVRRKADWDDIRLFWCVAESGSFGAAARALDAALTTITRGVDRLESSLNTKLFERGPQGVSLTEPGARVYDLALTMERSSRALENAILNSESTLEGRVKVAARDGLAGLILSTQLLTFLDDNPRIDVVLDTARHPDRPMAGEVDLTLTFAAPTHPDLVAAPLAHFLSGHAYIHHVAHIPAVNDPDGRRLAFMSLLRKRFVTNSSASSFNAIRLGAGLSVLPTAVLSIAPELVMLDLPVTSLQLWMVRHRDVGKSARIRRVEDWLRQIFDPRTQPWYRAEFIHPSEFARFPQARRAV